MPPADVFTENLDRINALSERIGASRERARLSSAIAAMPAQGWAARKFKSHVLALLGIPTLPEATRAGMTAGTSTAAASIKPRRKAS